MSVMSVLSRSVDHYDHHDHQDDHSDGGGTGEFIRILGLLILLIQFRSQKEQLFISSAACSKEGGPYSFFHSTPVNVQSIVSAMIKIPSEMEVAPRYNC